MRLESAHDPPHSCRDVIMMRFLSVLVIFSGAALAQAQPVSRYQGKNAGEWVQALDDPDTDHRYQAVTALGQLGPDAREAIPALLQLFKDKPRPSEATSSPNTLSGLAMA